MFHDMHACETLAISPLKIEVLVHVSSTYILSCIYIIIHYCIQSKVAVAKLVYKK